MHGFYGSMMMPVAIAIPRRRHLHNIGIIRERQFGHRTIHLLLHFLQQSRHSELWLVAVRSVGLAIPWNKLHTHPAKHVIRDRGSVADIRVLGEARRFEPLVSELFH